MKVLIAEDDTTSRLVLQRLVQRLGHEVRVAEDGCKAWSLATLDALAALGVRLSIDSFGTGYSSIAKLRRLPVQEIKLDHEFVSELENAKSANVLAFLLGLGIALGVTVVVKGMETRATWDWLHRLGCEAVQGFYVSRPLPAAELGAWLRGGPWHAETIDPL